MSPTFVEITGIFLETASQIDNGDDSLLEVHIYKSIFLKKKLLLILDKILRFLILLFKIILLHKLK